ncbi:MAG: DegV family EDD domain-containing protein [Anaerolineales bacterium]|nr:DegV family EDD domain-containing protein [Anaerolineales bacterium]
MKSRIGILTDRSIQFNTNKFLGSQLVNFLPLIITEGIPEALSKPHIIEDKSIMPGKRYQMILPSEESIQKILDTLSDQYDDVFILVLSQHINPLYSLLKETITKIPHSANFHLVDSQSISIGLGLLVQIVASSAHRGFSVEDIKTNLRCIIPRIYSLFCINNLSFLYFSGLLDPAQAVIGEMLGLSPCLLMENGKFIPTHKAKNFRHIIELFLEFTSEFENLRNIALLYGDGYTSQDFQTFRTRINHQFTTTSYCEHAINPVVSCILGPQTTGIIIMENPEK